MIKKCLTCKKEFKVSIYYVNKGGGKYCSRKCYGISKLGKPTWNKGTKGICKANSGSFKKGDIPTNWKGDNASYNAIHSWIVRHKGKPQVCEHCGATCKERRLSWANIDHKYCRNLDDFISLCYSCHRKYDIKYNNYKIGFIK